MAKKRNPSDSTLRNIRAANKKMAALAARVRVLEQWMKRQSLR